MTGRTSGGGASELTLRILSGLVMAAAAILVAWLGGVPFVPVLAGRGHRAVSPNGGGSPRRSIGWKFLGFLYASAALASPVILRSDPEWGLAADLLAVRRGLGQRCDGVRLLAG